MEPQSTSTKNAIEKALLVNVTLPSAPLLPKESLAELGSLAEAAGLQVVHETYQKRSRINPALYVGKGKAEDLALRADQSGADVIIFDNDLSPGQIRELEKIVGRKIIDRSELILDIFAGRARTHEAKLQVELAQLEYVYPRLTRMWGHLDTVVGAGGGGKAGAVGGVGTRGPGEKQLEIDRRLVKKRLNFLRSQIEEIQKRKSRQVQARHDHFTVSLVGYTNAGKSTLMNTLTGTGTFTANQLFATLDTKTSRWNLGLEYSVLLSDTVGFVRDLPHHLVASFRATLEEATHADLLLHVVDVSHPQAEMQMQAANKVLEELGCDKKDMLLLFNKVDRVDGRHSRDLMRTLYPEALPISARTGAGVDQVVQAVITRLIGQKVRVRVACSQADGKIPSFLRAHGEVHSTVYQDSITIMEATIGRRQLFNLQRLGPITCDLLTPESGPLALAK